MSLFTAIFAGTALPQLMANNGEPIEYIAANGAKSRLRGIVSGEEVVEFEDEQGGRFKKYTREVLIFSDERSAFGGVSTPQLAATVVVGETKYAVEAVSMDTESALKLTISRTAGIELTRPNLRSRRR